MEEEGLEGEGNREEGLKGLNSKRKIGEEFLLDVHRTGADIQPGMEYAVNV